MDAITNLFAHPNMRWVALVLGLLIAGAAVGYLLLPAGHNNEAGGPIKVAHTGIGELVDSANAAAAAEKGDLCSRALIRAQGFGVVPDSATLSGSESAAGEGHFTCQVRTTTGGAFTLAIEQSCDDLARYECLALDRVTASDGTTLFERRI
jgi:hypothetical protein